MTRKRHTPVVSFGDKLMRVLKKAALQEFSRELPWNAAVRLRQRLYSLRAAMRSEGHAEYDLVSRVRITIDLGQVSTRRVGTTIVPVDPKAIVTIVFQPNDSEFDAALGQIDTLVPDDTSAASDPKGPRNQTDILEDLLKDI